MKKILRNSLAGAAASLLIAATASAQSAKFSASRTFEFDPDKTGGAVAYWSNGIGETDGSGNTNFGLELEKNVPLTANVSAGAVLESLKGVVVANGDMFGYDMTNTSPSTGSGPRFNVYYTLPDGTSAFSFVGGANNATKTAACQPGWTRFRLGLQTPGQAFPPIPAGSTLQFVLLIVDEPGHYTMDNIFFRDQVAGKPGSSVTTSTGCP